MKQLHFSLERSLGLFLALSMACPLCGQVVPAQQVPPQTSSSISGEVPTSTATATANTNQTENGQQFVTRTQQTPATTGASQNNAPPASGTAVAPYPKQEGITGSKPAGAAIAAGKQRRTRSFAIRAGLLVGAAIAIGVVVGASLGSPARAN